MAASGPGNKGVLHTFDMRRDDDVHALSRLFSAQIDLKDQKNRHLESIYSSQVTWLEKYVNSPEFMGMYPDQRSKELMAEAAFWVVNLGLSKFIDNMSYADIRNFHPLSERFGSTERSKLIDQVCKKLTKPALRIEAIYALGQAAWAVYVRKHSYQKMIDECKLFEQESGPKAKL